MAGVTEEKNEQQQSAQEPQHGSGAPGGIQETETETHTPKQRSGRRFIIIGVVILVVVVALLFYWHSTYYESTDDAQIDGHLDQISARVAGQVTEVDVEENSFVQKGQTLAVIDPEDFRVTVQQSQANLAAAQANYEAANANVPIINVNTASQLQSTSADVRAANSTVDQSRKQLDAARARVANAEAANVKAQLDLERYKPLVEKDVISKQQFDAAVSTANQAQAALNEAQANLIAAEASVRVAQDRLVQAETENRQAASTRPTQLAEQRAKADQAAGQVQQAKAQLDQARLNLGYGRIVAPYSGIINKKNIEPGMNVAVGQNMMTIVSLDDLWVTANFKETQLRNMKPGQPVVVKVDAYGGRKYQAKVTQIGGATGSRLSLFPPENATGNYVKVVQRIPVRLDFTKPEENNDHLLRPGMSVTPEVRVKE